MTTDQFRLAPAKISGRQDILNYRYIKPFWGANDYLYS